MNPGRIILGLVFLGLVSSLSLVQIQTPGQTDETKELQQILPLLNRKGVVYEKATLSENGNILVVLTDQQSILVFNLFTRVCLFSIDKLPHAVDRIACSPDGSRMAIASADKNLITVWDTAQLQEPIVLQRKAVDAYDVFKTHEIRFGSSDTLVVSYSGEIAFWSLEKRSMSRPVKVGFLIHKLAGNFLDPDARMLVAGGKKCVFLTRKGEVVPFTNLPYDVLGAEMGQKDRSVYIGDFGGKMQVWHADTPPDRPIQLDISNRGVVYLHCSPSSDRLAIMHGKGQLTCMDRNTLRQVFTINQAEDHAPRLFRYALGGKVLLYIGKRVRLFHAEDGTEIEPPDRVPR